MSQRRGGHVQDLGSRPGGLVEMKADHVPSDGLPWKALLVGQEGADSGEERGLGPRGPRDPPPGMR